MALHTSSSSRSKRVQVTLVAFTVFIIYCIYSISSNFPSSNTASFSNTSLEEVNTPPPLSPLVDDNTLAPIEEDNHQYTVKSKTDICKTDQVLRNVDPNHTNAHVDFWKHLSIKTVEIYKKRWQKFISNVKRSPIPIFEQERGIVLVAGNGDTFQRTLTAIKLLRHMHHCQLPIEVWHLSDEQPSVEMRQELVNLDAEPKDLSDSSLVRPIIHRRDADKQFQIKAAAVINSSFKELLYLDSDNLPAHDPTFLFDTTEYKSTGALFWPDFWKTHGENKIFDVMGISCQDEWEQESGQMVIDKEKSWLPLNLAWYMQKHYEIYFQLLNGDKDTFKYAWKALRAPYHMVETFVGMAGTMVGDRFCGHTMLQYFPASEAEDDDRLLFVHANLLKITDKRHFIHENQPEHPWDLAKRSSLSYRNMWIKPEFYVAYGGRACMDFTHREGEPNAITENFDTLAPGLQANYFKYGGIGGETR